MEIEINRKCPCYPYDGKCLGPQWVMGLELCWWKSCGASFTGADP